MTRIITILFTFACIVGCNSSNQKSICNLIEDEQYQKVDTLILDSVTKYSKNLMFQIGEPDLRFVNFESFQLIIRSPHPFPNGTFAVIRMTKNDYTCIIKTLNLTDTFYRENKTPNGIIEHYEIRVVDSSSSNISMEKWSEFQRLISASKFWTLSLKKNNRGMLDGTEFILEGSRPEARICGKRTYQIYGDLSPNRDDFFCYLCMWLEANSNLTFRP